MGGGQCRKGVALVVRPTQGRVEGMGAVLSLGGGCGAEGSLGASSGTADRTHHGGILIGAV